MREPRETAAREAATGGHVLLAGRYEILQPLGRGGMGEVFLVRDRATDTACALKRLSEHAGAGFDELAREFEALARIRHPGVVAVRDLGLALDGTPFFTMEYVPGESADRAVVRGDWPTLFRVAAEVAHTLEVLHAAGVAHGDLKPSNIILAAGAREAAVKLLDFGLASLPGGQGRGHTGTPGFAAPERVRGGAPNAASDLYGLGATLYALVVGRPAFQGASVEAVLRAQRAGPPPSLPLEESGAPAVLVQLMLRLMAPEPADRPADARQVRIELEAMHPAAARPLRDRLQAAVVVGRDREVTILQQRLARARRPHLVVMGGEAGVGKTALVRELAARFALEGRPVTHLSCADAIGEGVVAMTVLRALASEEGAVAAAEGSADAEPDRLLDAMAARQSDDEPQGPVPAVLLDDAERLDPRSAALLRRMLLRPDVPAVVVIAAVRGADAGPLDEGWVLRRAKLLEWIPIRPLDEDGVRRLVTERLREPAPDVLTDFLWKRAHGHPGLSVELLLRAAEDGALRETEAGLVADPDGLAAVREPEGFEAARQARLEAMPEPARRAAAALAAWGEPTDPDTLRALAPDVDEDAVTALLDETIALRDAHGWIALASPGLGETILASLDPGARSALHRAALAVPDLDVVRRFRHLGGAGDPAALELVEAALAEAHDPALADEAARFAEELGRTEEARVWWERAARERFARSRYQAAIPQIERAMACDPSGAHRAEHCYMLSVGYGRIGRVAESRHAVLEGLALDPPPRLRSKLLNNQAGTLQATGAHESALPIAMEAFDLADDDESRGWSSQTIGFAMFALGRLDEAEEWIARSKETFDRAGIALGRVRAVMLGADVARARREPEEAERRFRQALDLARTLGNRVAANETLNDMAALFTSMGRWSASRETMAESMRIALEDQRQRNAVVAAVNLAVMEGLSGRPRAAARNARAGRRLAHAYMPAYEAMALRALSVAQRTAGRPRRAEEIARRALEMALRDASVLERCWSRIELGRALASRGAWQEAGEMWDAALAEGPWEEPVGRTVMIALAGRAALRAGDREAARGRHAEAKERTTNGTAPYGAAHAAQLGAEIALDEGRTAAAGELAREALKTLRDLPAPWDRAAASLEFARLAIERTPPTDLPVEAWLDDAIAIFERLGDRRGRAHALALLVRWLRRASAPVAARERDLLRAVSRMLDSILDLGELTERSMQLVVQQLDAERGVLLVADEEGSLEPMAEYGALDPGSVRDAVGYSRRVVRQVTESGGSLLIGDAPAEGTLSQSMVDLRLRSIVCVPMFVGGRVIGAVYLDDSRRAEAFGAAERALLEGFAHLMAIAIDKSRGHDEVRRANEALVGENLSLRQEAAARFRTDRLIGSSEAMQRVLVQVERAAMTNTTVLITGEGGTGKELIAKVMHAIGRRRMRPFVGVSCAAIPETLIESELFGILPNVATGVHARDGYFRQADGGTLFLDEIGDMPLAQQVRLLSSIANREITPVGGGKAIPVDVRIIAATNQDLRRMVADGRFREDLFYRLNVIPIEVPPLRERKADIPSLAHHFVAHFAKLQERDLPDLSPEFLAALMQSDWPGNVRELENYIERVLAMTPGHVLYPNPLPRDLEERGPTPETLQGRRLTDLVDDLDRRLVTDALERAGGNQSLAARELGIKEQAVRYRIRKYGIRIGRQNKRIRQN